MKKEPIVLGRFLRRHEAAEARGSKTLTKCHLASSCSTSAQESAATCPYKSSPGHGRGNP